MAITIKSALSNAVKLFKDSNIDASSLDAEVLLAHVLHCRRTDLYVNFDRVLGEEDISNFMLLVQKRILRMPLQYITGHSEFMSLDFIVNKSVLIPRPETEFVVESVIRKSNLLSEQKTLNILEIGTGCGNIAVSLAVNLRLSSGRSLKNVRIYTCDISKDALSVARTNARRHNVSEKISFLQGDLFNAFEGLDLRGKVNFVVSNPPYVAETERAELQPEVINHEPELAIFGGRDGLIFYRRIFSEAPDWLAPDGYLIMEMGEGQVNAVATLIREYPFFDGLEIVKDLQKIDRVLIAHIKKGDEGDGENSRGGGASTPWKRKN
ncbi:MAG TPA: peptide chain release factor N(5)-glutamine methyltransferase [Candidatus Brocadiia bacterium]|nr:peptide chain release factor N(5)-glutamine methyltransferase [Candidatus Brocadiales bacterium]